jgi:hypothetical protein
MRKKPDAINLTRPSHRVVVVQAYHTLLSQGLDIRQAQARAAHYALEHWDDFNPRSHNLRRTKETTP